MCCLETHFDIHLVCVGLETHFDIHLVCVGLETHCDIHLVCVGLETHPEIHLVCVVWKLIKMRNTSKDLDYEEVLEIFELYLAKVKYTVLH